MSGPKTSRYRLTATLLRRAEDQLRRLEDQRRRELDAMRQQQEAERQRLERQRRLDLESAIDRAQQRLARIAEAAQRTRQQFPDEPLLLPETPLQRPDSDDLSALATHLGGLESLVQAQEAALAGELARLNANASMRQTLAGLLRYAKAPSTNSHTPSKAVSKTVADHDRWIQRLDLLPGQEPPAEIINIIADLQNAPPARRPALETELTWRIQSFNALQKADGGFRSKANALYKTLPPPDTPAQVDILNRLVQAAMGKLPRDEDLLARA